MCVCVYIYSIRKKVTLQGDKDFFNNHIFYLKKIGNYHMIEQHFSFKKYVFLIAVR